MISKSKKNGFSSDLLKNKVALVTGAGKGIGRACAVSLASVGATVIAVSRTESDLTSLQAESKDRIVACAMDATSEEFLQFIRDHNQIDILINNLGTNQPEPFIDVENGTLDRITNINFQSPFKITQEVVRKMLAANVQGSIVNITSQMGHVGSPNRTLYCATKHAVEGLSKALAVELADQGIRVNSIAPTFIETEMTKAMLEKPEFNDFVMNRIPMGKLANLDDVANAAIYLASDLSDMVTGTSLLVDGGWVAQ